MFGFIYLTTNLINGKIYIGQHEFTDNPIIDDNYIGSGVYLKRAVKKYGRENFKREILRECKTKQELNNWEKIYIRRYKSQNREIGYNIADGDVIDGRNNPAHLPEVREKIRKAAIKRHSNPDYINPIKYHTFTDEDRRKMSQRQSEYLKNNSHPFLGKHHSEETKRKMRENHPNMKGENNPMYGRHHSEETKQRLRQVNLGKKHSKETKNHWSRIRKGENNPMYGSHFIWITNGINNKRHDAEQEIPEGWFRGMVQKLIKSI